MASLVVIYGKPADPAAFDAYYHEHHVPLAKAMPGLRSYTVSRGAVMTPAGPADAHLIATLQFDDMSAMTAALASTEGQAAADDVQTFADGGATLMMFETAQV